MIDLTPGSRRKLLRHIDEGFTISELAREMGIKKRSLIKLISEDAEIESAFSKNRKVREYQYDQNKQANIDAAKARIAENALRKMRVIEVREAGTAVTSGKEIIEYWAAVHGLTVAELKGRSRNHYISKVRQIAMYEIRRQLQRSLPEIGRMFDNRDHTTVLHAYERMNELFKGAPAQPLEPIVDRVLEGVAKGGAVRGINRTSGVTRTMAGTLLGTITRAA